MSIIPSAKPKISRSEVCKILENKGLSLDEEKVILVGLRGYYPDTFGLKGKNDIGCYDDSFVWIDEAGFATFNGNSDPSRYYKNVATLVPGKWTYKKGNHGISKPGGGYPAYRQAAPVQVARWQKDGEFKVVPLGDTINIHKGGKSTTSSAGCQTVPPNQWDAFKAYGDMVLERNGKKTFTYLLVDYVAYLNAQSSLGLPAESAPTIRQIPAKATDLIRSYEGLRLKAYRDSAGIPTIGYGSTKNVKMGTTITKAEAEALFIEDVEAHAEGVLALVGNYVTDNQFGACVSLAFNIGVTNFKGSSVVRFILAGEWEKAADAFLLWNKAKSAKTGKLEVLKGLVARRKAERELFLA